MATNKIVTLSATGEDGWVVNAKVGRHSVIIDQPESFGGSDQGPSPLDFVFVALASCLITIGKMVAMQRRIDLRGMQVEISGEVNLDVLRGKDTSERSGYKSIQADIRIDADLSDEEKKEFIAEIDRRCPVSDNLINPTPIQFNLVS